MKTQYLTPSALKQVFQEGLKNSISGRKSDFQLGKIFFDPFVEHIFGHLSLKYLVSRSFYKGTIDERKMKQFPLFLTKKKTRVSISCGDYTNYEEGRLRERERERERDDNM